MPPPLSSATACALIDRNPRTVPAEKPLSVTAPTAPTALSYELFPPRSEKAVDGLWETIRELETTNPDYVSVTYGAGGSNRGTTVELLQELLQRTTLRPLAHLTCIGNTAAYMTGIVTELLDLGVRGILALRGDRPKHQTAEDCRGFAEAGTLIYAQQLVELIRGVEQQRSAMLAAGKVAIGVAAYPTRHPESPSVNHDVEVLLAKQNSGADFAITQVFFHAQQYQDLLARARRAGVKIPVIPGVMPFTSARRVAKLAELSGTTPDAGLLASLDAAQSATQRMRVGVDATVQLANQVLDAGAPGLHLYTFNEHTSALEVLDRLDLRRSAPASAAPATSR